MTKFLIILLFCIIVTLSSAQTPTPSQVKPIMRKHPELFKVYSLLEELQVHLQKKFGKYGKEYNTLFSAWKNMTRISEQAQFVYAKARSEVSRIAKLIKTTRNNRDALLVQKDKAAQIAFFAKSEMIKAKRITSDALKRFQSISAPLKEQATKGDSDMSAITWLKTMVGHHHGLDCYNGKWVQEKKLLGRVHCRRMTCCKLFKQDGQWKHFCEKKHRVCK